MNRTESSNVRVIVSKEEESEKRKFHARSQLLMFRLYFCCIFQFPEDGRLLVTETSRVVRIKFVSVEFTFSFVI